MKKTILIALVLITGITAAQAQIMQVHLGASIPSGELGEYNFDNAITNGAGCATIGFNAGIKLYTKLKVENLSMVYSFNLYCNPLSKKYRDSVQENQPERKYTLAKYFNVPIMAGMNYTLPVSKDLMIYGEGSAGFNMFRPTKIKYVTDNYTNQWKFHPKFGVGFALEAGVIIQEIYTIGVNYSGLFSYKCKFDNNEAYPSITYVNKGEFETKLGVNLVTVTVGYRLFSGAAEKVKREY
ncbi:MAG: hypothetical protein PHY99_03660 [Bacteroidales bacterium]|nr:hypothetical protein [Bacteroidales bacterium]